MSCYLSYTSDQHNSYGETTQADASVGPANYRYQLSYDDAGRISDKVETLNGVTTSDHYSYDSNGRLTQVSRNGSVIESYQYDANGNRTMTTNTLRGITGETAQYNADDQLTQKGTTSYQYDANGRLSSKTTAQGTTTYQYGTRGELISVQTPDTLVEYLHNPLGQRIARKVNGQIVEKYHWLNLTTLLATYDANGNVLQRYEYAGGRTPTKLTQGTQTYYILSDYQGTPKLVTDTTGAVVKELSYDSFGNVIQDSNPTFRLPFGYAGGLYDPETQLVRFGHRDYDPDTGRWTARDPIGFGGGDYNLYRYVIGDTVNFVDLDGLEIRVYSSDAFGVTGLNHAFVYSTETRRGKGTNGSSWQTLGDGVGNLNSPYTVVPLPKGMTENEFMDRIDVAEGWNNWVWLPWINDCHSDLLNAFEQAGVQYPGAPNGRMDADDNLTKDFNTVVRQYSQVNNPQYYLNRLFRGY